MAHGSTLVTGATGFLGGHIVRLLRKRGEPVVATGRNGSRGSDLARASVDFRPADLARTADLAPLFSGVDAVIHSAALSSVWGHPSAFYDANVTGTARLILAAQTAGVRRFVHISTPSIYATLADRFGIREDDPLPTSPINEYARSKLLAEQLVRDYAVDGLDAIILRPRAIFGPGDVAIFPRLIKANARFGVPFIDGGEALQDLTYVENVAHAALMARDAQAGISGRAYNITNGDARPIGSIIAQVFDAIDEPLRRKDLSRAKAMRLATSAEWLWSHLPLPGEPPITRYSVSVLACTTTLDITRAREELGYRPLVSIDEGVRRFAAWWMR